MSSPGPKPLDISSSPGSHRGRSLLGSSFPRAAATARLASPVPSNLGNGGTPTISQIPIPSHISQEVSESSTPLAGPAPHASLPGGAGVSALAAALSNSIGTSPPRFGTPPVRALSPAVGTRSPATAGHHIQSLDPQSAYGSFEAGSRSIRGASGYNAPSGYEDPEIIRRHLVQPSETASQTQDINGDGSIFAASMSIRPDSPAGRALLSLDAVAPGLDDDEFSSLRMQGGDITRPIYKWSEEAEARSRGRRAQRSQSFNIGRPEPEDETLDIGTIKVPGGMRRNYLRRAVGSPDPGDSTVDGAGAEYGRGNRPKPFTSSFMEFLTLYGHFAGEELIEDDEVLGPGEYFGSSSYDASEDEGDETEHEPMEDSALLTPRRKRRVRKQKGGSGTSGSLNAAMLLLKSFVGTGVLFLPKAYSNGGMLFSNIVLLGVAVLSYYCFVLLVNTRNVYPGSFGDMGMIYGKWMRIVILASIVLSQIGFVAAYIVFTSENLQAFILAVSNCKTNIEIPYLILMQMAIFLPFSLMRDISKLGAIALLADGLIMAGLVYLYYYDILTIVRQGGVADIIQFNSQDWTLFIGTAIFTFEGIGLIIPIQEAMRKPQDFPKILAIVMVIITTLFISMGALSYASYGSKVETVVLLNLPQDNGWVNAIQLMYSVAILLSTPLQIFPAIRITETELFTRSGKYNPYIKWQKNVFRFFVVMLCAAIAWGGADDLDKFVALVGSFACIPLVYIYPPLLHLKAVSKTPIKKAADIILCLIGIVSMVYTTSLTLKSWAGASPPSLPKYCDGR